MPHCGAGAIAMADFPLVSRSSTVSVVTPIIPLNFVQPDLSRAQFVSIVRAYWQVSVLIGSLILALTIATVALWPRTYSAAVTLMVNYEVNDPLNGKELPLGQVGAYIATQVELMQTPEVLLAVVDRLDLTARPYYARGYRGTNGTLREWAAEQLRKTLAIYQGYQGSQLIHIGYSATNPREAVEVANAVADVYKEQDLARSTGPPGERAQHYASQLTDLKLKVDQAQQNVSSFHRRNGLIADGEKANIDTVLLSTLEDRLAEAQNGRRLAEARAAGDQTVTDQVLASSEVQNLKLQLANQELRLSQLNAIYQPGYPDIIDLELQRTATRRSLAAALKSYSSNAAGSLSLARHIEQNLFNAVAQQRAKALENAQLHDEAAKYLLELTSAQTVYKRALEGYDQIMFASAGHYNNVVVISRAMAPVSASKPRVIVGLAFGGALALFLGLGIPLIYEFFHRRIRCRDDLERHYGVPVLVEFGPLPAGGPS
jgi:succinoglycan biosynthesis transport protein ExoP